jgi:hypothetical protein
MSSMQRVSGTISLAAIAMAARAPRLARGLTLAVALLLIAGPSARAQIISNSLPFSFGYGANSKGAVCFTTAEIVTGGVNTPTNQGAFRFVPTVSGTYFSSAGPRFPDRVFINGDGNFQKVAAQSANFGLSITGTYTGAVPVGYTASTKLNITELRVRGISDSSFGASTAKWTETTPGQGQSSTNVSLYLALNSNSEYINTNNYRMVSWNPSDVYTPNTNSQTRSFVVTATTVGGQNNVGLDALEIFGTVDVTMELPPPKGTVVVIR